MDKLLSNFQTVKTSVDSATASLEQLTEAQNVSRKEINELTKTITFFSGKMDEYEARFKMQDTEIKELKTRLSIIENANETVRLEQDRAAQYSRRESLIFHGIPESPQEDTDMLVLSVVNEHLNIAMSEKEISVSHRLGAKPKPGSKKVIPIIVRFTRRNDQYSVYMSKRKLAGTKVMITES